MNIFLPNNHEMMQKFQYPTAFVKAVELNLLDFDLWYIMTTEQVLKRIEGLKKRYPLRELIPFARRDDCDDIACFELGNENKVLVIHDFSTSGYEQQKEYIDFWEWLDSAIKEMIDFNRG